MATHDVQPGQRIWVDAGSGLEAATVVRDDPQNRRVVVRLDSAPDADFSVTLKDLAEGMTPPLSVEGMRQLAEAVAAQRQRRNMLLPVERDGSGPRVRLTADTERLLAVLLRPVTPAEAAWADVLRAIVIGDRAARLGAAAALADLVKAELEG